MTLNYRAGAPFDPGNLFNTPAIDAGPIINLIGSTLRVDYIDAGTFRKPIPISIDGGNIPLKGTATYNPNKKYGPTDIIV